MRRVGALLLLVIILAACVGCTGTPSPRVTNASSDQASTSSSGDEPTSPLTPRLALRGSGGEGVTVLVWLSHESAEQVLLTVVRRGDAVGGLVGAQVLCSGSVLSDTIAEVPSPDDGDSGLESKVSLGLRVPREATGIRIVSIPEGGDVHGPETVQFQVNPSDIPW